MRMPVIVATIMLVPAFAHGQGVFLFSNVGVPTRIGLATGPLAGPDIWAQMLVGTTTDSLIPVGMSLQHLGNGIVSGPSVAVSGIPEDSFAYIQMVAWDGVRWGTSLGNVPPDQLGRTDIVRHFFTASFQPASAPLFTMPAIVPIPEPSTWALGALGAVALCLTARARARSSR